jgi:predicted nucleotidyltransferase
MDTLTQIFSSKVRAALFRILFGFQARELHVRELEREAECTIGPIQSELKRLLTLQLVTSRRSGNRLYYKANKEHPLYPDLRSMVVKTTGLSAALRDLFKGQEDVCLAFIFGSLAGDTQHADSDIDLMVIGDMGLRKLSGLMAEMRGSLGREINPHILTVDNFAERCNRGDHFISTVLQSPKIFIKGGDDDLETMVR